MYLTKSDIILTVFSALISSYILLSFFDYMATPKKQEYSYYSENKSYCIDRIRGIWFDSEFNRLPASIQQRVLSRQLSSCR